MLATFFWLGRQRNGKNIGLYLAGVYWFDILGVGNNDQPVHKMSVCRVWVMIVRVARACRTANAAGPRNLAIAGRGNWQVIAATERDVNRRPDERVIFVMRPAAHFLWFEIFP